MGLSHYDSMSPVRMQILSRDGADIAVRVCLEAHFTGYQNQFAPRKGGSDDETDLAEVMLLFERIDIDPAVSVEVRDIGGRHCESGASPTDSGCGKKVPRQFKKKGGFDKRPECRVEGARDNGPGFFQFPRRLETEADDGNPRGSQLFEGVFALSDCLLKRQRPIAFFPECLCQESVPQDKRRMNTDHIGV
jgi:hypothetical protein